MAMSLSRLGERLRATVRKGNSVRARVESANLGYATVRLSEGGSRLTNLSTLGGNVEAGEEVYVDYRAGVAPTVRAIISETLVDNPCVYQTARAPDKYSWDWPDWPKWPPWEWPWWWWNWPPWDWPPWDWPIEDPDPDDKDDLDVGIMVTRYTHDYWYHSGDTYYWGQPFPPGTDLVVIWRQADEDSPGDESAWPVCGWDTFYDYAWWSFAGIDTITIPRDGVYIINTHIGYWTVLAPGGWYYWCSHYIVGNHSR